MKKKKKGRIFDIFAIFIAFLSLFFNILLLYNIMMSSKVGVDTNQKGKYSKKELGEYFKNYQSTNNLAYPDKIVLWDVSKITYRGFFKGTDKKLYYVTEKFTCISVEDCIIASGIEKNPVNDDYDYIATFVISINSKDPYDLKFDILDYSIENSADFIQDEIYDLE